MSDAFNPYAPPQADALSPRDAFAGAGQDWRLDGDRLIVRKGATLPAVCIWTGEPAEGPRKLKTLTWTPGWVRFLVVSPLILLIAYLIVKKSGTLGYALSQAAQKRQRNATIFLLGGIAGAVLLIIASAAFDTPVLMVLALLFFVAAVVAAARGRTMRLLRIDKEFIYLRLPPPALEAFTSLAMRGPI